MRRSITRATHASFLVASLVASFEASVFAAGAKAPPPASSAGAAPVASTPPAAVAPVDSAAAPAGSAAAAGADDAKDRAKEHFINGIQMMQDEAWDSALAEFLASLTLFPTKNAIKNAASCLNQLERFDEALSTYQELLARFGPQLSTDDQATVTKAIESLKGKTAFVVIKANVDGATVVVNNKVRGKTPLKDPILVKSGTVAISIAKDGYSSYVDSTIVAARDTRVVTATLGELSASGHLQVVETEHRHGKVLVDGVPVGDIGDAGYEGTVSPGQHTIVLQGDDSLGTQPATITIMRDQTVTMRLTMEELKALVRIEPDPPNAQMLLDGVDIGRGTFEGRLRAGSHTIDAKAPGYFSTHKAFEAVADKKTAVRMALDKDEDADFWAVRKYPLKFSLFGGAMAGTSLGGDYESGCGASWTPDAGSPISGTQTVTCPSHKKPFGLIVGARVGFEVWPGLSLELSGGYARVNATVTRDNYDLLGDKSITVPSNITDQVLFNGEFVTVGASYAFIRRPFMLSAGVGIGAMIARTRETRSGTLTVDAVPGTTKDGTTQVGFASGAKDASGNDITAPVYAPVVTSLVPILMPEVRFALPIGERIQVGIGVGVMFGIPGAIQPVVNETAADPNGQTANDTFGGATRTVGYLDKSRSAPEAAVGTFVIGQGNLFFTFAF